ncbi:hypothetical protein MBM09_13955 [Flaviramulus sp. BrNp1-15]|uniref:hypothetical protein n=1 Tax=Flaviramulus sp. BrNp1-15 TaxID=2916754 RepID=UPI001EE92C8B|nr:hypothetical protein [Flaviramulus sp. BrNp1-15]ULC59006.1 hypothetical protein MBM09_13955 [Flaviramulus sp. BrNp1-15]
MISIALLILFLSFYIFYNTSKKVKIQSVFGVENWFQKHIKPSKFIALILLVLALILFINHFGIGVGTLLYFIALMTIGSLVILLYPLNLINYKSLILLIIFMFSFEFITF